VTRCGPGESPLSSAPMKLLPFAFAAPLAVLLASCAALGGSSSYEVVHVAEASGGA